MEHVFLMNPSFLELDDAYRELSNRDFLKVKTTSIGPTIGDLERIGFVAIQVVSYKPEHKSFLVSATKGKHGPCFYSGKAVEYTGKAMAVLDDDNHIFINGLLKSVCDKTSHILCLLPYAKLIKEVSGSNNPLTLSDANDFEQSQETVFQKLKSIIPEKTDRRMLFYPGPFRLLILIDGTLVRRGKWTNVPNHLADDLITYEGLKDWNSLEKERAPFFQEVFVKEGPGCLLKGINPKPIEIQPIETDFTALKSISSTLKDRLINLIKNKRTYFILIGNEADDKLGCCPSEEVTEANSLVRSGILDALSEPVQGDACPVTLYGFKDELSTNESGFSSKINSIFRDEIYNRLSEPTGTVIQVMLKWILLVFIASSIFLAVRQCHQFNQNTKQKTLSEVLVPSENLHVQVVLFHNKKRCFQCERMEKFTEEVLEDSFQYEAQNGSLKFNTVIIDDPENADIVQQYGIFTSTVVLVKYDSRVVIGSEKVLKATRLYQDELAFKALLENEIHNFLSKTHE